MTSATTEHDPAPARTQHKPQVDEIERHQRRWGFLFISPWIIGFLAFFLLPMGASLVFSFMEFDLIRPEDAKFIGFDNYQRWFEDPLVRDSLLVTVKYAAIMIPISLAVPLGFAWLLTSKSLWFKPLFRTLFFVPTIVPFVSTVFIWNGFLNTQTGWLNDMLGWVGIDGPDWLNSTTWIYPALSLMGIWAVGNAMLLFIAGIQGVPVELYEAAEVDGASSWHKFKSITVPMISPILFYNLVLSVIALFQYFLVPFVLKNGTGDPDNSTLFYSLYFFKTAFTFNDMGYGATLAWMLFLIIMVITMIIFATARYWVYYEFNED
jgi:multiple sugar transport system permease protein